MTQGSDDCAIAFSTADGVRVTHVASTQPHVREILRDEALSPLFQAAKEATEEAIINSLLKATTVAGYMGRTSEAVPVDRLIEICKRFGAIPQ